MQELLITNIQRMSFHDGPGMRTTVFLKGCNLRCAWCHNPETQNPQPELIFRAQRCVRCGTCVHSCASGARTMGPEGPVRDTARCVGCGRCAQACLTGAIDVAGRRISCQELTELVLRDEKIFRTTAGGVTCSGGEPLLRPDLPQLLEKIKALGYAVKLDTNGAFPERLEAVVRAGLADDVAMDIKNSPERYAETAGVPGLDLTPVFRSVSFLLRGMVNYEFRTTAVAELHDDASFLKLGDWLAGAKRYYIQCFQPRDTVLRAGLSAPTETQLRRWAELVRPKIPAVEIRGI